MRIALSLDVLEQPGLERTIIDILSLLTRGRHDLFVDDPEVSSALRRFLETQLAGSLQDDYLELVEKFEVASAWEAGEPSTVVIRADCISELLSDLTEPARVIVEDLVSDGAFIRALASVYKADRLAKAINLGQLQIVHAGGKGRVKEVVAANLDRYHRLKPVIAVIDSDRLAPGLQTSSHRLAQQLLQEFDVETRVLEFREAENYVPNRCIAMAGWGRVFGSRLNALSSLNDEQRAYFDMKKGFPKDDRGQPRLPDDQQHLYGDVPVGTLTLLCDGFGDGLLATFETHATHITPGDMRSLGRGAAAELLELLRRLEDLI